MARNLVRFWYAELAREDGVRYRGSGRASPAAGASWSRLIGRGGSNPEWHSSPARLSAAGVATRVVAPGFGGGPPRGVGSDPTAVTSGRQHDDRVEYARRALRHVAVICYEARLVLEMEAAGWSFGAIAAEIRCSEPVARAYFEAGLACVMSFQHLAPLVGTVDRM